MSSKKKLQKYFKTCFLENSYKVNYFQQILLLFIPWCKNACFGIKKPESHPWKNYCSVQRFQSGYTVCLFASARCCKHQFDDFYFSCSLNWNELMFYYLLLFFLLLWLAICLIHPLVQNQKCGYHQLLSGLYRTVTNCARRKLDCVRFKKLGSHSVTLSKTVVCS